MRLDSVVQGAWCPFCANKKLCKDSHCVPCTNKSFDSHPRASRWHSQKNLPLTPRDVFKNSNKKYWFNCETCNHDFEMRLDNVVKGKWCPFCTNKILCKDSHCVPCTIKSIASHPTASKWNFKLNYPRTPRDVFKSSRKKYWFDCETCEHSFKARLDNVYKGTWCPTCKLKTEGKVLVFLKTFGPDWIVKHQFKPEWLSTEFIYQKKKGRYQYSFDFLLTHQKTKRQVVFEIDGPQHVMQVSNWQSPFLTQIRDAYKERCAKRYKKKCAETESEFEFIGVYRFDQLAIWKDTEDWKKKMYDLLLSLSPCGFDGPRAFTHMSSKK